MPTRTTLTLDDDVAASIEREVRRSGRPIRAVVNEALRDGLKREPSPVEPFVVTPYDSGGLRPGLSLDSISELVEIIEGPRHG